VLQLIKDEKLKNKKLKIDVANSSFRRTLAIMRPIKIINGRINYHLSCAPWLHAAHHRGKITALNEGISKHRRRGSSMRGELCRSRFIDIHITWRGGHDFMDGTE